MPASILSVFVIVAAALALFVAIRTDWTRSREGKILAFLALAVFPGAVLTAGFFEHMNRATSTQFCLSCHVMTDYGKSLLIDDPSYIPAQHYQNIRIPRDRACFSCHTEYTMFGDYKAKIRGMHHLEVQYFGKVPKPEAIKLYVPYQNRECLHCHLGARKFEEGTAHHKSPDLLPKIKSGEKSCLSSGCHEFIHDVGSLKDMTFWQEPSNKEQ